MTEKDEQDMTDLLAGLTPISEQRLQALHDRLAANAESAGLLDVSYRTMDSSVGTLLLAATPLGIVRVAYEREGLDSVLETLSARISPRVLEAPRRLDEVTQQLDEYLAGRRQRFDVPIDLRLSKGFQRSVLDYLPDIAYGRTASYAAVATAIHHPRAFRAVGTACATNPLPLIVPCHRVIHSDGLTGAYIGGPETKRQLLNLEAAS
jgi:methylated-DNA-[protein]-cysteine S-methyltransferase